MFFDVDVGDNGVNVCFPFYSGHICFANNMVSWFNKTGVNFSSICDIKIALPGVDNKYPTKVDRLLHYQILFFFYRRKFLIRPVLQLLGYPLLMVHLAIFHQLVLPN